MSKTNADIWDVSKRITRIKWGKTTQGKPRYITNNMGDLAARIGKE